PLDAGGEGRPILIYIADQDAFPLIRNLEGLSERRSHFLDCNPHPTAHNLPGLDEGLDDIQSDAARNCESNPLRASRTREDRRIDPDQLPVGAYKRAPGITRIDGRVGLDEIF